LISFCVNSNRRALLKFAWVRRAFLSSSLRSSTPVVGLMRPTLCHTTVRALMPSGDATQNGSYRGVQRRRISLRAAALMVARASPSAVIKRSSDMPDT
jgi:hypothetical protein